MTDFVAALRQNIEAILIRHFPETPPELQQVTMKERQKKTNKQSGT